MEIHIKLSIENNIVNDVEVSEPEVVNKRPEGAIDMNCMLQLIANSQIRPIKIYKASRKHTHGNPWVETLIKASMEFKGKSQQYGDYTYIGYIAQPGEHSASIKDANMIPNNYNDWYHFETYELALKYLQS